MSDTDPANSTTARLLRGATAGLVAGVVASFAMEAGQALAAKLSPSDGGEEEPATAKAADRVAKAVTGAPVPEPDHPLAGQIVHYALGAGLGLAYGIAAEFSPRVTAGYGAGFGLTTAALLDEAAVPAAGLGTPPWSTSPATHAYTIASHLVFGAVAELTRRQVNASLQPQ